MKNRIILALLAACLLCTAAHAWPPQSGETVTISWGNSANPAGPAVTVAGWPSVSQAEAFGDGELSLLTFSIQFSAGTYNNLALVAGLASLPTGEGCTVSECRAQLDADCQKHHDMWCQGPPIPGEEFMSRGCRDEWTGGAGSGPGYLFCSCMCDDNTCKTDPWNPTVVHQCWAVPPAP